MSELGKTILAVFIYFIVVPTVLIGAARIVWWCWTGEFPAWGSE